MRAVIGFSVKCSVPENSERGGDWQDSDNKSLHLSISWPWLNSYGQKIVINVDVRLRGKEGDAPGADTDEVAHDISEALSAAIADQVPAPPEAPEGSSPYYFGGGGGGNLQEMAASLITIQDDGPHPDGSTAEVLGRIVIDGSPDHVDVGNDALGKLNLYGAYIYTIAEIEEGSKPINPFTNPPRHPTRGSWPTKIGRQDAERLREVTPKEREKYPGGVSKDQSAPGRPQSPGRDYFEDLPEDGSGTGRWGAEEGEDGRSHPLELVQKWPDGPISGEYVVAPNRTLGAWGAAAVRSPDRPHPLPAATAAISPSPDQAAGVLTGVQYETGVEVVDASVLSDSTTYDVDPPDVPGPSPGPGPRPWPDPGATPGPGPGTGPGMPSIDGASPRASEAGTLQPWNRDNASGPDWETPTGDCAGDGEQVSDSVDGGSSEDDFR